VWRRDVGEERLTVRCPYLGCLHVSAFTSSVSTPTLQLPHTFSSSPNPSTSLPRKHRRFSTWFNMQTILTPLRRQSVAPTPESEPQRLFQCSTCKRSFTRADHLTRHVRAREYLNSHAIRRAHSSPFARALPGFHSVNTNVLPFKIGH
jgi:uncharacterized Zn-finger protein